MFGFNRVHLICMRSLERTVSARGDPCMVERLERDVKKGWYPFLETEPQMFQRKLNDVVSYCVNLFISCALQFSLLR